MAAGKSRYTLVKGQYWIHYPDRPRQGPQPDGDTVRFQPDNPELVRGLPWFSGTGPDFNTRGNLAVRYEGVDTLETHFGDAHQELQFANAARAENLRLLGFTNVRYFSDLPNVVQSVDANPLPGYVIANGIEANGRMLGLVYAGSTAQADGSNIFVDAATLDQSVNSRLVSAGLAYVEPYDTMPISLIQHLREVIGSARQGSAGVLPDGRCQHCQRSFHPRSRNIARPRDVAKVVPSPRFLFFAGPYRSRPIRSLAASGPD